MALLLVLTGCIAKQDEQPPLPPEGNTVTDATSANNGGDTASMPPLPPDAGNTQAAKSSNNGPPLPPE